MATGLGTTATITGGMIKIETYKAFLIEKNGNSVWIPKSQVKSFEVDNEKKNDKGQYTETELIYMEIPKWLADKGNVKPLM